MKCSRFLYSLLLLPISIGCASSTPDVAGQGSQLEIRQIQTRTYDTLERDETLRSVIATLQDLGFTIQTADASLGTVTASRLYRHAKYKNYLMRMTVTVRSQEDGRVSVRANARMGEEAITKAETYQDFFVALDKAMFLTAQKID